MRFGMCVGNKDSVATAAAAGFDYIECCVGAILCPDKSDAEFRQITAEWKKEPRQLRVLNCFLPQNLPICSPDSPLTALYEYAATAIRRAGAIGIEKIVFGSGKARNIPDGYDRQKAQQQLLAFSRYCAQQAADNGIIIALEPLNRKECNIINGVREGAQLVREVNSPSFRLLVDAYHWALEKETASDIASCADLLAHAHIASWPAHLAPGMDECGMETFIRALADAGYNETLSVEANISDPEKEYPTAIGWLRGATACATLQPA